MGAMTRTRRLHTALLACAALAAPLLAPSPAQASPAIPWPTTKMAKMINVYRELHGAPPLKVNEKLRRSAQRWADRGVFEHSGGPYGENLAVAQVPCTEASGPDDPDNSLRLSVDLWYREVEHYDFHHPDTVAGDRAEFDKGTGHFTQLVWRGSRSIGVGIATHPGQKWKCVVVAQFDPPGNYLGQFRENVRSAKR
jgi:hypothetical protein